MNSINWLSVNCWNYFVLMDSWLQIANEYVTFIDSNYFLGHPYYHFIWTNSSSSSWILGNKTIQRFSNLFFLSSSKNNNDYSVRIESILGRQKFKMINYWNSKIGFIFDNAIESKYEDRKILGCTLIYGDFKI